MLKKIEIFTIDAYYNAYYYGIYQSYYGAVKLKIRLYMSKGHIAI